MMLAFLAAMALSVAPEEPRRPADPCPAIERLMAAARERQPFGSVRAALARGEAVVPGFAAGDCRVDDDGLRCDDYAGAVYDFAGGSYRLRCPGLTQVEGPPEDDRRRHSLTYAFTAPGVRLSYGTTCMGCAGLGRGWVSIVREPPRRRRR